MKEATATPNPNLAIDAPVDQLNMDQLNTAHIEMQMSMHTVEHSDNGDEAKASITELLNRSRRSS